MGLGLLSLLTWLPVAGGLVVLLLGDRNIRLGRWVALATAVVVFGASIPLWTHFNVSTFELQFPERLPWIPALNWTYYLGVDGISMPLILLTTLITVPVVVAAWTVIENRPAQYYAAFLIMEGLMVGVFSAADALLFYFFWEAMLIPMFLIIGVWGGPRRVYATLKFFLYTFLGSVFMLVALIYMYLKTGDYSIAEFHALPLSANEQMWIFFAFLLAFAVKIPMVPVHTWLPDAHVEAPTGGSVVPAAIMLKMGGYGFLRFSLPIAPDASRELDWLIIALSLIAVVYIGLVALVQQDMKKLIAYSSIAHMGFVTIGIFTPNALGLAGSIIQMLSHGLVSAALFMGVGVVYDRLHTHEIARFEGLVNRMPLYAATFMLFTLASVGLPGTSGFVGEVLVIVGVFGVNSWVALLAATGAFLSVAYMLWLYRKVFFGFLTKDDLKLMPDLRANEVLAFAPLVVLTLLMGIYPALFLEPMRASVDQLMAQVEAAPAAALAAR